MDGEIPLPPSATAAPPIAVKPTRGPYRSRRVIVRVNSGDGSLVEDFALLWNHSNGFKLLGAGFFTRGETMRNMK